MWVCVCARPNPEASGVVEVTERRECVCSQSTYIMVGWRQRQRERREEKEESERERERRSFSRAVPCGD